LIDDLQEVARCAAPKHAHACKEAIETLIVSREAAKRGLIGIEQ
jgi:hypothetical protein